MGNSAQQQVGTPIDNNLIALLVTGQTDRVISKIEADQSGSFLKESINFRNDNILHYACAKNNFVLADYIVKKNPNLCGCKNDQNQYPADLTNDSKIRAICQPKNINYR